MNGNFLDTNIIIDLFRGNNKTKSFLEKINFEIPIFVIGELYYGIENSSNKEKHLKQVINFIQNFKTVNSTLETAKIYASIKKELKVKGKPIPENDIWIAALSIENNYTLITNDGHFDHIKGLEKNSIIK